MGSKTNTATQTSEPWAPSQPYVLDTIKQGQNLYNNASNTVAPFNNYQTAAFNQMAQLAGYNGSAPGIGGYPAGTNIGGILGSSLMSANPSYSYNAGTTGNGSTGIPLNPNITAANDLIGNTIQGGMIGQNPYIGAADTSGVFNSIREQVAKAVGDQFSSAGRTGSPAEQVTLAKAITDQYAPYALAANENMLNRGYQDYANQQQNQLRAAQFAPQLAQQTNDLSLFGPNLLSQIGSNYQNLDYQARNAPYNVLSSLYGPIVQGTAGLGGMGTTTQPGGSVLGGALGGAAAGASAGSIFGPPGAVVGGVLGGIGGLF